MPPAKLCLSCKKKVFNSRNIIMESNPRPVTWKKKIGLKTKFPGDRVIDLTKPNLRRRVPRNPTHSVEIDLGQEIANRWVLYYAAEPAPRTLKNKKQSAPEAYKKEFRNQGLTRTDKNGRALLTVRCPQSYKEGGKVYPRHVHFMLAKKNNLSWNKALFTVGINCQ